MSLSNWVEYPFFTLLIFQELKDNGAFISTSNKYYVKEIEKINKDLEKSREIILELKKNMDTVPSQEQNNANTTKLKREIRKNDPENINKDSSPEVKSFPTLSLTVNSSITPEKGKDRIETHIRKNLNLHYQKKVLVELIYYMVTISIMIFSN